MVQVSNKFNMTSKKVFTCARVYMCVYKPVHACISVYTCVAWLYTSENYTCTALSTYGESPIFHIYFIITKGSNSFKIAYKISNHHDFWLDFWFLYFDFWFPHWFLISKMVSYLYSLTLYKWLLARSLSTASWSQGKPESYFRLLTILPP